MPKNKAREFGTIEQALLYAVQQLEDDEIQRATKRKREDIVRFSDPSKPDRNITHLDSINLDIEMMKKNKGHPLLSVHQAIMDKALHGHNQNASITQSLLHMGERLGHLMGVTEKAMDPGGPGGSSISINEKEEIYRAIAEVEEKIASLKKSIT